jgi:hypothetical protein
VWLVANKADASTVAIISGLCGTALGSLGSMLSSVRGNQAQDVNVVNKPSDPVPVIEDQP